MLHKMKLINWRMENGSHGNRALIRDVKRQKSFIAKDTKLRKTHRFTWNGVGVKQRS